jgi:hypothetical protein
MKLKNIAAAAVMAFSSIAANAALTDPVAVSGNSFNAILGSISLPSFSSVSGGLDFAGVVSIFGFNITLPQVTFTSMSLGTSMLPGRYTSQIGAGNVFSFAGVTAGNYDLSATGSVAGGGSNFIQAQYTITPVPEPESYAMLLAGLGVMGAIARRRNKAA